MSVAYDNAYEKFNSKYHVNSNLYNEYISGKAVIGIDDFSFDVDTKTQETEAYISTLATAFNIYFRDKIKIEDNKKYEVSDISLGDFIVDFDKLMNGIRTREAEENKNPGYVHEKFAGLPFDQLASRVWNRISPSLNKPLHKLWAAQIRSGSLSIDTMRNATSKTHNFLRKLDNGTIFDEAKRRDLANVVLAKDAMKQAIKSRSIWSYLNPANWKPYYQERAYYNELKAQIREYENKDFPLASCVEDYTDDMLTPAHNELMEFATTYEQTKQENAPQKESIIMNSDTYEQILGNEVSNNNPSLGNNLDIKIDTKSYSSKDEYKPQNPSLIP